jgi:hypothetical protein
LKKIWTNRRGFLAAGFVLLYLAVNIWLLYRLSCLKEYADIIAISFPEGSITESAFDQWRENADSKAYVQAAVWRSAGGSKIRSENTGRSQEISCYRMKGQPEAVWGKELAEGRYFTEGEEQVCLLDQYTARQLFGSEKAAGLKVRADENVFRIVGVLKGDDKICVVPAKGDEVFDAAAVRKGEKNQSSDQAFSMLETAFGAPGSQKIDGQFYYAAAGTLYVGITSLTVLWGSMLLLRKKRIFGLAAAKGVPIRIIGLAAAAGVLILGMRIVDPGSDYLPTYWSDFDFFVRLFGDRSDQVKSLSAHQEFSVWAGIIGNWRQAAEAEWLAAILALSGLLQSGSKMQNGRDREDSIVKIS